MGFFAATQAAIAAGRTVFRARLVHLNLVEEDIRLWADGFGTLSAGGFDWIGAADVGSLGETPVGINDQATSLTVGLSGISPEIVALARDAETVRGRDITVYWQFLDEALQPLDSMFIVYEGLMDVPSYAATGPADRSIQVPCETIWTGRNGASFAFWSQVDQRARFPGPPVDDGFNFVVTLKNKKVAWPDFDE